MAGVIFKRALAFLVVCTLLLLCAASMFADAAGEDTILIDGAAVSGEAMIPQGQHTITVRTGGGTADLVCIAVYENLRFQTVSTSGTLEYDFPESGAEIVLFLLDSQLRPLRRKVRVVQKTETQKLAYTGQAVCYDELFDEQYDEYEDFNSYTVQVRVVTDGGRITEIRDITGYDAPGKETNTVNASYLSRAAGRIPAKIVEKQSTDGIDAVSGATCASHAILRAVQSALESTPEPWTDGGEDGSKPVPDGVYRGSAQCLTGFINYMVDVDVTVQDGTIQAVQDRTLRTPMSTNDKALYALAWNRLSGALAQKSAEEFQPVDAVSGATVSSAGINAAVRDALTNRTPAGTETGTVYAPEGISLYARVYPVVTVQNGKISKIRIVPGANTDTEKIEAFAEQIVSRQSVSGLTWPTGIADEAFSVANLTDQILYGTGVLP